MSDKIPAMTASEFVKAMAEVLFTAATWGTCLALWLQQVDPPGYLIGIGTAMLTKFGFEIGYNRIKQIRRM